MEIKTVTIIGANGTMGYNAAAMFASFGQAKVYMVSRDIQKSRNAVDKAIKAVRAESIRANLVPCDYSALEQCVSSSDLVFESVAENLDIKKEITQRIGSYARANTILATGTSGLSINKIAGALPPALKKNYYGMHFFNPPYSMPLLELIPSETAHQTTELKEYLEKQLLRTVIVCKDSPAFLANRIGFQFLNLALQYAETYRDEGGIDYIDAILGPFTGRAMCPCATADFVGLDVHKAIVDNLLVNTHDSANDAFRLPAFAEALIDEGKLGKKTSCGLYKTELCDDGKLKRTVYDIKTGTYVEPRPYAFAFSTMMKSHIRNGAYQEAFAVLNDDQSKEGLICKAFLRNYIDYSLFVVNEVCDTLASADDGMAAGFNWCPPLALSNALFHTEYPTKYDYRSFFKAGG